LWLPPFFLALYPAKSSPHLYSTRILLGYHCADYMGNEKPLQCWSSYKPSQARAHAAATKTTHSPSRFPPTRRRSRTVTTQERERERCQSATPPLGRRRAGAGPACAEAAAASARPASARCHQYDPLSYSRNFDLGTALDGYSFASRFVLAASARPQQ
jgi:hypothetical protein